MIVTIEGKLISKKPPALTIQTAHGLGYRLLAPMSTFYQLPECGEKIGLHVYFHVREDAQLLYGFISEVERELFSELVSLNGVGPKLALAILSSLSPYQLADMIQGEHVDALLKIPGVGKKTASRLLLELKDKIKRWDFLSLDCQQATEKNNQIKNNDGLTSQNNPKVEAEDALISLGYKNNEAKRMISRVFKNDLAVEDLIKLALQSMVAKV